MPKKPVIEIGVIDYPRLEMITNMSDGSSVNSAKDVTYKRVVTMVKASGSKRVTLGNYDQNALRYFAVDSIAKMLLMVFPMMVFCENRWLFGFVGKLVCGSFVILNSLLIIAQFLWRGCVANNSCGGVGNPSIIVGLSIVMLPVFISSWRAQWPMLAIVCAATILSKSSIALGLLAVYFALSMWRTRAFALAVAVAPLPLVAGYFLLGADKLISSSDRFMIWKYMMERWMTPWNVPFGTGWGTYHVFSINLQHYKSVAGGYFWNTMHNEPLQMIFETGVLGGLLLFMAYTVALYKTILEKELEFAFSIILFGLFMCLNPALHQPLSAVFAAWLFLYATKRPLHQPIHHG